jgi:ADP-glucose pyrophosphorylase
MEGVVLGDMVTLDGCVVCKGAKIANMCSLKECFVGAGYEVEEGTKLSKQNLVDVEEFSEDDDEDEDEDEEDSNDEDV